MPVPRHVTRTPWLRRDQWELFCRVYADKQHLPRSYDDWLQLNQRGVIEMSAAGFKVRRVEIDVEQLIEWCRRHNRPVDSMAMMEFSTEVDPETPPGENPMTGQRRTDHELQIGGTKFTLTVLSPDDRN